MGCEMLYDKTFLWLSGEAGGCGVIQPVGWAAGEEEWNYNTEPAARDTQGGAREAAAAGEADVTKSINSSKEPS